MGVVTIVSAVGLVARAQITSVRRQWPTDMSALRCTLLDEANPNYARYYSADGSGGWRWAAQYNSGGAWDAGVVETALCDSMPVMLQVNGISHWVVATGMQPYWESGNPVARGTYSVADPLLHQTSLLPLFANTFRGVVLAVRGPGHPMPISPGSGQVTGSFGFVLTGAGHAGVQTPDGGTVTYDPTSDGYVASAPSVIAIRGTGNPVGPDQAPHDVLVFDTPAAGTYRLFMVGDAAGPMSATVAGYDPQGSRMAASCSEYLGAGKKRSFWSPTPAERCPRRLWE